MPQRFRSHIEKFVPLTDGEFADILSFFQVQEVKKKVNLLREGEVCRYHYFVLSGCLRKFFITEKGQEQTTEFAIENWWMTDTMAYERRQPTGFYIQTVEPAAHRLCGTGKIIGGFPKDGTLFPLYLPAGLCGFSDADQVFIRVFQGSVLSSFQ